MLTLGTYTDAGSTHELTTDTRSTLIIKSPETLRRLFIESAHRGETVSFFGDSSKVLPYLPPERIKDTILFELSDTRPIGFDPLQDPDMPTKLPMTVDTVWPSDIPTTQLDRYLVPACIALIETGGTLFQLPYLYSSERFRARVLSKLTDPVIRKELEDFGDRSDKEQHQDTNSL